MSKTVSFHLQKGGVGKTTISGTVACESALRGFRTILVDLDPQGNASSWFFTSSVKYEVADVLKGVCFVDDAIVKINQVENLYLLPSFGIGGELKKYGENTIHTEPYVIKDLVDHLAKSFDCIILDLSPGLGNLEVSALIASDEIITPMTPEIFSLDGLEIFIEELKKIKTQYTSNLLHKKIIINSYDSRIRQHKKIMEVALKGDYTIYKIPVDPTFRKSQEAHMAPQMYKYKGKGLKTNTAKAINEIASQIWR